MELLVGITIVAFCIALSFTIYWTIKRVATGNQYIGNCCMCGRALCEGDKFETKHRPGYYFPESNTFVEVDPLYSCNDCLKTSSRH